MDQDRGVDPRHARVQIVYDIGLTSTVQPPDRILYGLGHRNRSDGSLKFIHTRNKAWTRVKFDEGRAGRYQVIHGQFIVQGRLEMNNGQGQTSYRFKYPLTKDEGATAKLYFEPSIRSNHPPPMTSPEVPSIVPVSTERRPTLPRVRSYHASLLDLWQTPSGAYGQQPSTSTASEGPKQNLDIPHAAPDLPWYSHDWDIASASHDPRAVWDSQNPYIPAAIPDARWGSDNLRPTPSGAYGQQPSTSTASEGPQQNLDIPHAAPDLPWYSHDWDIASASHDPRAVWDSQNPYIPAAIPDARWGSDNLRPTPSGAYGQQPSTSTASEGPQKNLDIPHAAPDPPRYSHDWDIASASHDPRTVWDSQNPYIPAAIPDARWGSDDLRPTPSGAYGQQPSTSTASEGPQQNLDIPHAAPDLPWYSHDWDIASASHDPRTVWDSQNPYIPAAIPDARSGSDNLWPTPSDAYGQQPSTSAPSEGPQQNLDITPTVQDPS
jgi:hypothetical protein